MVIWLALEGIFCSSLLNDSEGLVLLCEQKHYLSDSNVPIKVKSLVGMYRQSLVKSPDIKT